MLRMNNRLPIQAKKWAAEVHRKKGRPKETP